MESRADQVSLLDLLLVLAENAKLLLMGPLLAGLVALGVSFQSPQQFVSEAILAVPATPQPPTQAASLMRSPLVLDPVVAAFDLAKSRSVNQARQELASSVKSSLGKDGLLRLEVTGPSPDRAQAIANALIDAWLKTTRPGEQDRKDLETRLTYAKELLEGVSGLMARLSKETAGYLAQPLTRGEAGTTLAAVGELQARYLNEVLSVTRQLQGLTRDVVVQAPTLPTEHVPSNKSMSAVLAALAAGFVLLVVVFVRRSWRKLVAQPEAAPKLRRLRATVKRN